MVLATSKDCVIQAMSWETRAFSVQFHVEIEDDTVANWARIQSMPMPWSRRSVREPLMICVTLVMSTVEFNRMAERLYELAANHCARLIRFHQPVSTIIAQSPNVPS